MRYYPMFVNLENRSCLVVGAGGVGRRKIRSLLDSGAGCVTVVDTAEPDPEFQAVLDRERVVFHRREFEEADLDGQFLVIVCTSSEKVNQMVAELCDRRNILCNVADMPEECSFIVPASVTRGDLTVAVSTGGASPAVAKRIRRELQETFGEEYAGLLGVMGRLRPLMLGMGLETERNTRVFRALADSDLLSALKERDLDAATQILKESLPDPLHANIPELLDGFI